MKKTMFVLSRKNQTGQVAIFVALIFQVIFVFFALLINVGLLVHHKINLQQSVDLAAYYGAMKEAESLNAMAHVNFQIRQAWKLLTWRYRVLGTFGLEAWTGVSSPPYGGPNSPAFPLKDIGTSSPAGAKFDDLNAEAIKCKVQGNETLSTVDIPFFCIGHKGMKGWDGSTSENNCKVNCSILNGGVGSVSRVPRAGGANISGDQGTATRVNVLIDAVNLTMQRSCEKLGPANLSLLGGFIASYYLEQKARSQTMQMLAANLSNQNSESILDLDGNPILVGVKNTLKNNLTEANATSLNESKIKVISGLSNDNCRVTSDPKTSAAKGAGSQFMKRIEFKMIQLFIQACQTSGGDKYQPGSIFTSTGEVRGDLDASNELRDLIATLELTDNEKFTVGYEKNPWCEAYYSVKAESEPKIPFLPLSKIKLTAIATAKPFGGSMGPRFGKEWPAGESNSQDSVFTDRAKQTDMTLPFANQASSTGPMSDLAKMTLNFSRSVGDTKGLSDTKYLAEYHAALLNRKPSSGSIPTLGSSKSPDNSGTKVFSAPDKWPSLTSWKDAYDMSSTDYDPLAKEDGNADSYLRDLEISAIAPNQFDLTYYSIDPDFYNNYYTRLSNPAIFSKLKNSAGIGPDDATRVRPDFGNNKNVYKTQTSFSVRNQIEIVAKIFKDANVEINGAPPKFLSVFPELATKQSSLLTGWTFSNLSNYIDFPDGDVTKPDGAMAFGKCLDPWHGSDTTPDYKSPTEFTQGLPATPGNCVTGGRVGYSVKLVSPSTLRSNAPPQPLGGPNTSGPILNPIPEDFFNF